MGAVIERYEGEVRRTRSRSTGALVVLHDAERSTNFNAWEGGRWVTMCDTHGAFVQHETRAVAERFMPWPSNWCDECQAEVAARLPD